MKKFVLILFFVFLTVAALAVIAPFVVDINRFKGAILERVQRQTGYPIEVGHISWKAFPSLAIRLEDFALKDKSAQIPLQNDGSIGKLADKQPGRAGNLFSAARLDVALQWAPLLAKRLEIGSIVLDSPNIIVHRDKDGKISLGPFVRQDRPRVAETSRGTTPREAEKPAETGAGRRPSALEPETMQLGDLRIANGTFELHEEKETGSALQFKLRDLKFRASDIALGRKIRFQSSAKVGEERTFPIEISGWVGPVDQETLRKRAWSQLPGEIRVAVDKMDMQMLQLFWNNVTLTPALSQREREFQMKGTADLDISLSSEDGKLSYDLDFTGDRMEILVPGKLKKPLDTALRVQAIGSLQENQVWVDKGSARLASAKMTLRKVSYRRDAGDFQGTISLDLPIEEAMTWMEQTGGALAQGRANADLDISGNVKRLREMRVEGNVELDCLKLRWPGILRRSVEGQGNIQFRNDQILLRGFQCKVGRSDVRLDGKIGMRSDQTGEISLESRFLDLQEILDVFEKPASRPARAARRAAGPISQPSRVPAAGAILKAQPVQGATGQPAGVGMPQAAIAQNVPEGIARWSFSGDCRIGELVYQRNRLTDLTGQLNMSDGVFTLSKFAGNGCRGSISTAIQVDLLDPNLSFRWGGRLSDIQINDVIDANSNFGGRVFGRLTAQLELTGYVGSTQGQLLSSLDGAGRAEVADMRIATVDMMDRLSVLTGLLGIQQDQMEETRFDWLRSSLQVRGGRVFTPDVQAQGNNFDLVGRGSFGFDRTLDYTLQVKLSEDMTARLGQGDLVRALIGADRRMVIPFAVSGSIDGPPRFQPLWEDILTRQAAHQLGEFLGGRRRRQAPQTEPMSEPSSEDAGASSGEPTLEDLLLQILKK